MDHCILLCCSFAVAFYGGTTPPRLVALVAQVTEKNYFKTFRQFVLCSTTYSYIYIYHLKNLKQDEIESDGGQVEPPGMNMIYLPYSNDIRDIEEVRRKKNLFECYLEVPTLFNVCYSSD